MYSTTSTFSWTPGFLKGLNYLGSPNTLGPLGSTQTSKSHLDLGGEDVLHHLNLLLATSVPPDPQPSGFS